MLFGYGVDVTAATVSNQYKIGNTNSNATPLLLGDLANNRLAIGGTAIPTLNMEVHGADGAAFFSSATIGQVPTTSFYGFPNVDGSSALQQVTMGMNAAANFQFDILGAANCNTLHTDMDVNVASGKAYYVNGTQVVGAQQAAMTTQLTTLTYTAPGTTDYALQDLVDSGAGSAFGFATKDEGNTALSVIANLQVRVLELETKLQAHGLVA